MSSRLALTCLLLCGCALAGDPKNSGDALARFSACRHSLPAKSETYLEAKCVGLDPAGLIGKWHKELVESIGYPDWCLIAGQTEIDGKKCFGGVTEIAYSYYVMPANTPGGGPELMITLSKQGQVFSVKWMHSQ